MPLLDEVGLLLQTAGLGTLGTTIIKSSVPLDEPMSPAFEDALIALLEVPGYPALDILNTPDDTVEQPVVQVVIRGAPYEYEAARAWAQQVYLTLRRVQNQLLSGTFYLFMQPLQPPFALPVDALQRPHIVFRVRCQKAL